MEKVTIDSKEYLLGDINKYESGEVYKIDGELVLAENCIFDFAMETYLKTDSEEASLLVKGIVKVEGGDFKEGYFSPSLQNEEVYLETKEGYNKKVLFLNDSLLRNTDYIPTSSLMYEKYDRVTPDDVYGPFRISKEFKQRYPYGAGDVLHRYMSYFDNVKMKISSGAKQIHSLLGGLSVGVEFETNKGLLSNKECYANGLIPLRDGSIEGIEYVTIPINSEKGIQALINSIILLNKKATIDYKCALHYHYGNVPRTKEFIVAFWIVMSLIQDDLYKYQLPYKRDNRGFKNKDYAKPLPNLLNKFDKVLKGDSLDNAYNVIIEYLAMGLYGSDKQPELKNIEVHPADPNNTQKWNVKTRYTIANLIPLIFGNKKTIEFRHHDISLNSSIIINEMVINAAIINYVIKYQKEILENILNINLYDIIALTIDSSKDIDRLFNFLEHKRSDVNKSFIEGDVFRDFTHYDYTSLVKYVKSETVVDNKFDIDFYKKNNIGNNARNNNLRRYNVERILNDNIFLEQPLTLTMFNNIVVINDNVNQHVVLSDDNKILNINQISGQQKERYATAISKIDYASTMSQLSKIIEITHPFLSENEKNNIADRFKMYLNNTARFKVYLFSFLYCTNDTFKTFANSMIKTIYIAKARGVQRYDNVLSFNESTRLFDSTNISLICINNVRPTDDQHVKDILDYILDSYVSKIEETALDDLSPIVMYLRTYMKALNMTSPSTLQYYKLLKGENIVINPLNDNKLIPGFYKGMLRNCIFKRSLIDRLELPLNTDIEAFMLFNPNLIQE